MRFSFAVQVGPLNGQELNEYPDGIEVRMPRPWTDGDREEFPQAEHSLTKGCCLVVDRMNGNVYAVATNEAGMDA